MLNEKQFERLISSLDSFLTTLRSSVKFVKETRLSRANKTNFLFLCHNSVLSRKFYRSSEGQYVKAFFSYSFFPARNPLVLNVELDKEAVQLGTKGTIKL